jgi:hypothetical protein
MGCRIQLQGSSGSTFHGDSALTDLVSQENYMVDARLASFAIAYDLGRDPKYR